MSLPAPGNAIRTIQLFQISVDDISYRYLYPKIALAHYVQRMYLFTYLNLYMYTENHTDDFSRL